MIIESEKIYLEIKKMRSYAWQNAYSNQLETTTKTTMSYHLASDGMELSKWWSMTSQKQKETPLLLAMWISLGVVENSMEILLNKNR